MIPTMERLTAVVTRNTEVSASVIVLVEGLAQQLRDAVANGASKEQLLALADEIEQSANREAAAVEANTPQAPTPVE